IDRLFLVIFIVLGVTAALIGSLLGFLTQIGVVTVLQPDFALPTPGLAPLWLGLATGTICLLAFALPPLLKLRAIAPLRVIRRDLADTGRASDVIGYGAGIIGILGLMWWYSGNLLLTVLTFAGATAVAGAFAVLSYLLLRSGRALGMQAGSVWRLALAGMQQRSRQNTTQILAFGLAIMLILIIFLVRTALITEWRAQLPEDAPNHFAFNIAADEVEPIQGLFDQNGVDPESFFALVQGTIVEVATLSGEKWEKPDEIMVPGPGPVRILTAVAELPADNEIVTGAWWPSDYDGPPLVSLEVDFARATKLTVGDTVTFALGRETLTTVVASIRTVRWETLQPNFFLILSPGAIDSYPTTFVTAFYLPPERKLFLNDLLRAHPTTTVIEVDAIIEQIQTIIDRVTLALEIGLGLILVSGGLVLLTSIQASMDERMRQQAILRTLGASRRLVMGSLAIEFAALGLFAGVLATVGAEVTAYLLETQIFRLDYTVNTALWIIGPVLGTVLIGAIGTIATLRLVNTPPTTILREVL
ncbi:MAG: ABC transporter permease, partial [Alphaproteobacteria bacterium]